MSDRACIAVNGKSRHGKSYLVKNKLIPQIKDKKPVVVFDRLGEYKPGDPDCPDYFVTHEDVEAFFSNLRHKHARKLSGVHVIQCRSDADYIHGFRFFEALKKPVTLVLDEAHDIFFGQGFKQAKEQIIRITRYGGHYGIDIVMISQRTKDVPPNFRSQITGVISFRQSSVEDVKCLESNGFDNAEKVRNLSKKEFEIFGDMPKHINLN